MQTIALVSPVEKETLDSIKNVFTVEMFLKHFTRHAPGRSTSGIMFCFQCV